MSGVSRFRYCHFTSDNRLRYNTTDNRLRLCNIDDWLHYGATDARLFHGFSFLDARLCHGILDIALCLDMPTAAQCCHDDVIDVYILTR